MDDLVPIGKAAELFGLTVSTLRYWDERGLVTPTERRGGRRWYSPDELHRIGLIQMWQECGLMSLDDIAAVFAGANWRAVLRDRVRAIEEQITRLEAGKGHLEHALICPSDEPATQCSHLRAVIKERMRGNKITPEEIHGSLTSS
ncbi:MerR family transcriptional regulator [Herbihabitans rhizosphaerae]|uniref:MerR family transcriptional regulator n=1 Tax=Herbihabitans rhizosphaerae TaxID=1872711 RepID=A0A4Q7KFV9_9PSEU|nr:MerR family transcriptional regulator [Herbihabitans rhizosphaerae]RZS32436.1 MerR family transcriptional regulator [Herbihabitans rhizosphaerae]